MSSIYFSSRSLEYKELSNFYPSSFHLDGYAWPTVEHYFQAMKFPYNPLYQDKIRDATSPQMAKAMGSSQKYEIHENWDSLREGVMKKALHAKFTQNEELKKFLLSTGQKTLIEDTNDEYWGKGKLGQGKNRLGVLLMELRSALIPL